MSTDDKPSGAEINVAESPHESIIENANWLKTARTHTQNPPQLLMKIV